MSEKLQALLQRAKLVKMTSDERERQRRGFAYGNTNIENERITRETVERAAAALAEENSE